VQVIFPNYESMLLYPSIPSSGSQINTFAFLDQIVSETPVSELPIPLGSILNN